MAAAPCPDNLNGQSTGFSDRALCYYLMRVEDYPQILSPAKKRFEQILLSGYDNGRSLPDPDREVIDQFFEGLKQPLMSETERRIERLDLPSANNLAEPWNQAGITANGAASSTQTELALRLMAPSLLLQPCWLQNIAHADRAHLNECAHLFRIYARSVKADSRRTAVRRGLNLSPKERLIPLGELYGIDAFLESETPEWAYSPPAIYLILSFFTLIYMPETLGFTLAFSFVPRLAPYGTFPELEDNADRTNVIDAIRSYRQKEGAESSWKRIRSGFDLYLTLHDRLRLDIEKYLNPAQTLKQQVVNIFKEKAPFAAGHHGRAKLGPKLLDDWFSADVFDSDGFLDELLKSGYLNRQSPQNSRLLTELISFEGPMFGVFTECEIDTIMNWLEGSKSPMPYDRHAVYRKPALASLEPCLNPLAPGQKYQVRTLFYQLLNLEYYPETLPSAKNFVEKILIRSKRSLMFGAASRIGRFSYTHESFETYIDCLYQREMSRRKKFEPPPKFEKAIYRWGVFQLAPTVLVDGCWLQSIASADNWASPLHQKLFSIFADEIGNGSIHNNHPNVYRKLLASLDIKLPDFKTREFAFYPDFLDASFDLPVYLLAISHFPKAFLPEIIGLNLAIELSGLGATYQGLVDEMDYWGIDSHIVRLHQSIDNLASGHSAIAKQVVMIYLDQVACQYGQEAMIFHWNRIGAGYASLGIASRRLKWALLRAYCTEFRIPEFIHSVRSFFPRGFLGNSG